MINNKSLKISVFIILIGSLSGFIIFSVSIGLNYEIIDGTGEIKYSDIEGGFYGIISDDGKSYDPLNLADDFKIDGLRVHFIGKIRTDIVTYHMWGRVMELIFIEEI
ncbi:MAG: hypothetical protein ACFE9Z_08635 [Promethearchaeota archaeon]